MALFKKKNQRKSKQNSSSDRRSPVMRYYNADNKAAPANRKERITKEDSNRPSARASRFFKNLPQKLIFIAILALLIINTTLASTVLKTDTDSNMYRSQDVYSRAIDDLFNEKLLNKSKFSFDSTEFENQIIRIFPEVRRAVAIVPIAGRELQVNLQFSEPLLRFVNARE